MKTQKEVFEALLSGKKVYYQLMGTVVELHLSEDGFIVDENGERKNHAITKPELWSIMNPRTSINVGDIWVGCDKWEILFVGSVKVLAKRIKDQYESDLLISYILDNLKKVQE